MDVGGTLTKIVYFEKKLKEKGAPAPAPSAAPLVRSDSLKNIESEDHQEALHQLYANMREPSMFTIRDINLTFSSKFLGGDIHFLHFETRNMVSAVNTLSSTAITENIRSIGCTGGGAQKYARIMEEELGITLEQHDELSSLVKGMAFALTHVPDECYTYRSDISADEVEGEELKSSPSGNTQGVNPSTTTTESRNETFASKSATASSGDGDSGDGDGSEGGRGDGKHPHREARPSKWRKDVKEHTRRVTLVVEHPARRSSASRSRSSSSSTPTSTSTSTSGSTSSSASGSGSDSASLKYTLEFPYLVVNIGSGVSILKVTGPGTFERVSGSSLGGGV